MTTKISKLFWNPSTQFIYHPHKAFFMASALLIIGSFVIGEAFNNHNVFIPLTLGVCGYLPFCMYLKRRSLCKTTDCVITVPVDLWQVGHPATVRDKMRKTEFYSDDVIIFLVLRDKRGITNLTEIGKLLDKKIRKKTPVDSTFYRIALKLQEEAERRNIRLA